MTLQQTDPRRKIREFTDLKAWGEAYKLALLTYQITKKFPKGEIYSLIDQMRRAAVSISSNIAEGFGRQTYKEKVQFYYQAQGSLIELKNQFLIAKGVGYLSESDFQLLSTQANIAHQLLQGLIQKSKSFIIRKPGSARYMKQDSRITNRNNNTNKNMPVPFINHKS
ncbi:MAG: four helix bundle protein [Candidatus Woesebacteria bacterium]|nr:four helix bundle protein [Candidatus Woesebacteria bacterium]